DEAYTVVINNDPFIKEKLARDATFQFFRVYKGGKPVTRGTPKEKDAFNPIRAHGCKVPVLFVHVHAPGEWVSIIERRDEYANLSQNEWQQLLDKTVAEDVKNFEKFAGSFYKDHTKEPLKVLSAIALACTHYPSVSRQIEDTLQTMGINAKIVAQGESFAQYVLVDKIKRWMVEKDIQPREVPIPRADVPEPRITSYTIVNEDKPDDVKAAAELPNLCRIISPKIGGRNSPTSVGNCASAP
ncbi:hypothetical protein EBZ35_08845, partial [bacterium]|nr:hypothetical protein [bacterium]